MATAFGYLDELPGKSFPIQGEVPRQPLLLVVAKNTRKDEIGDVLLLVKVKQEWQGAYNGSLDEWVVLSIAGLPSGKTRVLSRPLWLEGRPTPVGNTEYSVTAEKISIRSRESLGVEPMTTTLMSRRLCRDHYEATLAATSLEEVSVVEVGKYQTRGVIDALQAMGIRGHEFGLSSLESDTLSMLEYRYHSTSGVFDTVLPVVNVDGKVTSIGPTMLFVPIEGPSKLYWFEHPSSGVYGAEESRLNYVLPATWW
ncbi:MAG: hypothetical protein SF028_11835 [Candidatus Sumerlaeia bacterium]|nr:hypothetical protein [Candidatus Sumerlaeia bacterium]